MPSDVLDGLRALRLRFDRPDAEARFADDHFARSLPLQRVSIMLGIVLYSAFGVVDQLRWPELAPQFWAARAAVDALLALTLALSFTAHFRAIAQTLVTAVAFTAGLAIVWMMAQTSPPDHLYYVGLIIIVFYLYHFLRVSFLHATVASWLMLAAYNAMALTISPVGTVELVTVNFFLVAANIVGMVSGYFSELYIRRDFAKTELLRENERQFASIADNLPGAVFRRLVAPDGTVTYPYVSANLRAVLDRDPAELVENAEEVFAWIHPDDLAKGVALMRGHDETMKPMSTELRFVAGDGTVKWLRISAHAYMAANGDRVWDGVALDITDLKSREDQLRQAQKMEAVGQLTGGIAHDFNNMLTVVIGNLDLFERKAAPEGPAARLVASAIAAARRGSELTQRLLAFSRRQPLQPKPVDLDTLVAEMADLVERTLSAQIDIVVAPGANVPPALADHAQVENALLNLSLNARDAMPDGGTLTIETGATTVPEDGEAPVAKLPPGEYVWLAVSDTGTGMPPDVRERAFEPFFTTKGTGEGSGLGLSMIYGFARQSGGTVTIYSEEGAGTTVRLYLPRASDAPFAGLDMQPEGTELPHARPGETVLVVEDDEEVRGLAAAMLEQLGYTVLAAGHGPAAMALLRDARRIDLLFTDIALPAGISGPELAQRVRARRPDVRVLYTSGFAAQHLLKSGAVPDGVELLNKPYTHAELAAGVRRTLDQPVAVHAEP